MKTDLDADTLDRQILEPYRSAEALTINGEVLTLSDATRIRISSSEEPGSGIIERRRSKDRTARIERQLS